MMRQDTQEAISVIESCAGFTDEATPAGEAWQAILGELNGLHSERTRLIGMANHQARVIEDLNELQDCKDLLQRLGKLCGCDHVVSADERMAQVNHIEEAFESLRAKAELGEALELLREIEKIANEFGEFSLGPYRSGIYEEWHVYSTKNDLVFAVGNDPLSAVVAAQEKIAKEVIDEIQRASSKDV